MNRADKKPVLHKFFAHTDIESQDINKNHHRDIYLMKAKVAHQKNRYFDTNGTAVKAEKHCRFVNAVYYNEQCKNQLCKCHLHCNRERI